MWLLPLRKTSSCCLFTVRRSSSENLLENLVVNSPKPFPVGLYICNAIDNYINKMQVFKAVYTAAHKRPSIARKGVLFMIFLYQRWVSPVLPRVCRFEPTCSEYTWQAVERFGVLKGIALGLLRVSRCHPFHSGGTDPVPSGRDHR